MLVYALAAGGGTEMTRDRTHFLFLNIGHFLDHLFMLIFATAAALVLAKEWHLSYGELIGYATPGFLPLGCARTQPDGLPTSGAGTA